jgi:hypothetical protein
VSPASSAGPLPTVQALSQSESPLESSVPIEVVLASVEVVFEVLVVPELVASVDVDVSVDSSTLAGVLPHAKQSEHTSQPWRITTRSR